MFTVANHTKSNQWVTWIFKHLPHTGKHLFSTLLNIIVYSRYSWHNPSPLTPAPSWSSNPFKCDNGQCVGWQLVLGETGGIRAAHERCSLQGMPPGTSDASSCWRQAVPAALAACQCTWYVGGDGQSTLRPPPIPFLDYAVWLQRVRFHWAVVM